MKRLRNRGLVLVLFGLLSTPLNAFAATMICGGIVETLQYDSNDLFAIKLSSMNTPVFFCSPQATWTVIAGYSTGPETCKMLYATFLAAKLSGLPLSNVYFDGDTVPASCNTWAAWQKASIRHYELQ